MGHRFDVKWVYQGIRVASEEKIEKKTVD